MGVYCRVLGFCHKHASQGEAIVFLSIVLTIRLGFLFYLSSRELHTVQGFGLKNDFLKPCVYEAEIGVYSRVWGLCHRHASQGGALIFLTIILSTGLRFRTCHFLTVPLLSVARAIHPWMWQTNGRGVAFALF